MIPREPFSFKRVVLKFLILGISLLLAGALFIAATSLWVGFVHQDREGSWVPLFAGGLLALVAVWLFVHLLRALLRAMSRSDILGS